MQCVSQCLHAPCASMLPVLHVLHASPLSYIARFVLAHYTFVLFLDSVSIIAVFKSFALSLRCGFRHRCQPHGFIEPDWLYPECKTNQFKLF